MDSELKEKLALVDQQIHAEMARHELVGEYESSLREDWSQEALDIEQNIFAKVENLQNVKTQLITGYKPPEIVYKDVVKYQDRVVENRTIIVVRNSPATLIASLSAIIWATIATLYIAGFVSVQVHPTLQSWFE